jgi:hypothetical protein
LITEWVIFPPSAMMDTSSKGGYQGIPIFCSSLLILSS